jgi:phenylalanine ammonia-lyase
MQMAGVLPVNKRSTDKASEASVFDRAISNGVNPIASLAMPEAWVRGAMLIRMNSLTRGHSAVRLTVIESLAALLRHDIVPLVPLRGSISASGDLSPLSYIAGALEGNPDVQVWMGPKDNRLLTTANLALQYHSILPIKFGPKEGLGILNGTAFSASVCTLALHDANQLAILSQVLTAMGVEALLGTPESFEPFIARIRPHEGQIEVSANIFSFLSGSEFAKVEDLDGESHLRQDRYALRTSAQWIGPYIEDLALAQKQLEVELNSTTDNPLFDVDEKKSHHGGNFQAASCTSSTEKTRLALQMIGKMVFAQSTELHDVSLSKGLPPNLASDEPSLSYTGKGIDINMAAYMSELAFLANPVSSHVQSAEMGNQGINSLALISARYTHMALDTLWIMSAAHLYSLCQALDLRAMHANYLSSLRSALDSITSQVFFGAMSIPNIHTLQRKLWGHVEKTLSTSTTKDSDVRFDFIAKSAQPVLIEALLSAVAPTNGGLPAESEAKPVSPINILDLISSWTSRTAAVSQSLFLENRTAYYANPDAKPYLGAASKKVYSFLREDLNIPFHKGLCEHPVSEDGTVREGTHVNTGSRISKIHEAMRDGRLMVPVMEVMKGVK